MNPLDDKLNRLFRAAVSSHAADCAPMPYGLETRVVAAWRGSAAAPLWNNVVLTRGLILASLIMILSLVPALSQRNSPDSEYLQLTDSTVPTDYP
jgi:hypothetical protein